jgi:hypothetical protein
MYPYFKFKKNMWICTMSCWSIKIQSNTQTANWDYNNLTIIFEKKYQFYDKVNFWFHKYFLILWTNFLATIFMLLNYYSLTFYRCYNNVKLIFYNN